MRPGARSLSDTFARIARRPGFIVSQLAGMLAAVMQLASFAESIGRKTKSPKTKSPASRPGFLFPELAGL